MFVLIRNGLLRYRLTSSKLQTLFSALFRIHFKIFSFDSLNFLYGGVSKE